MTLRLKTLLAALGLLVTLLACAYQTRVTTHYNPADYYLKNDYAVFYRSTQLYFSQHNIYLTADIFYKAKHQLYKLSQPNANMNPPLLTLLILWLGKFSFFTSLYIWQGLSIIAGIAGVYLLQKTQGVKTFFNAQTLTLATVFLYYYPSFVNFRTGQIGLFVFLGMTVLWWLSRRRKEIAAGILLGVLLNIKLFLGLFILFFIVQRRWRLLLYCFGTLLLIFLITLLVFGAQVYQGFYQSLQGAAWFSPNWNASVYGYLFRFIDALGHGKPVALLMLWLRISYGVISLLTLAILIKLAWPKEQQQARQYFDLSFCFTLSACLFLSPLGWNYYFPMLLIAIYTILRLAPRFSKPLLIYGLTWLSVTLSACTSYLIKTPQKGGVFYSLTWGSKDFYALFFLMLTLILLSSPLNQKSSLPVAAAAAKFRRFTYPLIILFTLLPAGIYGSCLAHYFYGK